MLKKHCYFSYIKVSLYYKIMSDNNEEYQNTLNDGSYEFELGQYIYLLQEREFRKTKEKIYKLGKTKQQHNKRFGQYPKDSILLTQLICDDCDKMERILINLFNEKFKKRTNIGNEYFEGDYKEMIDLIYNTIKQEETEKSNNKEIKLLKEHNEELIEERDNLIILITKYCTGDIEINDGRCTTIRNSKETEILGHLADEYRVFTYMGSDEWCLTDCEYFKHIKKTL